jgi:D-alanyl-D-alanine dipeptidase
LYETYPDSTYVASPRKGSVHNTGSAVDISLIDLKTGEELAMPTEYDDFTEKAWPDYDQLPDSVKRNRDILISVMKKWGFEVYPSEWWHFNYKGWEVYHLMDLTFRELLRD